MVTVEAIEAKLRNLKEDKARIWRAYLKIEGAIQALEGLLDGEEGQEVQPAKESGQADEGGAKE